MEWYYAKERERIGPVSEPEFRRLTAEGDITPETLVWNPDMPDWRPWRDVRGAEIMRGAPSPGQPVAVDAPPTPTCVECGGQFDAGEGVSYSGKFICARCKPIYFQRLKEGAPLPGGFEFASFAERLVAKLIDGLFAAAVSFGFMSLAMVIGMGEDPEDPEAVIYGMAMSMGTNLLSILLSLAYYTYFVGRFGATPGKMMMGLRVVTTQFEQPTYARALGRAAAEMITAFTCNIGYLMPLFDAERRALHDHIASTYVVRHPGEQ